MLHVKTEIEKYTGYMWMESHVYPVYFSISVFTCDRLKLSRDS